jgi:hypothetical protein
MIRHLQTRLRYLITDIAAYTFSLAIKSHNKPPRPHNTPPQYEETIEELAGEILQWEALYHTTRQQLAIQTAATERLLAMLEPLTKDNPHD